MPGTLGKVWAAESLEFVSGILDGVASCHPCSPSAHPTPVPAQGRHHSWPRWCWARCRKVNSWQSSPSKMLA